MTSHSTWEETVPTLLLIQRTCWALPKTARRSSQTFQALKLHMKHPKRPTPQVAQVCDEGRCSSPSYSKDPAVYFGGKGYTYQGRTNSSTHEHCFMADFDIFQPYNAAGVESVLQAKRTRRDILSLLLSTGCGVAMRLGSWMVTILLFVAYLLLRGAICRQ